MLGTVRPMRSSAASIRQTSSGMRSSLAAAKRLSCQSLIPGRLSRNGSANRSLTLGEAHTLVVVQYYVREGFYTSTSALIATVVAGQW